MKCERKTMYFGRKYHFSSGTKRRAVTMRAEARLKGNRRVKESGRYWKELLINKPVIKCEKGKNV